MTPLQKLQDPQMSCFLSVFRVKHYDSDCTSKSALAAAVDAKAEFEPDLFLGPPCSAGKVFGSNTKWHWLDHTVHVHLIRFK